VVLEYAYLNDPAKSKELLSVTAAMDLAKRALEGITVSIIGEVSDLSDNPRYKAVYFTLADERSALPCLMWRSAFDKLGVQLKSGMKVEVHGRFSLYSAKGRMQFDVRSLSLAGEGLLRAQVAQLATKLKAQGLMDEARKLSLPAMPKEIALVTSPRGKAVHDVLRTLRRRFPLARVLLFGVGVEGKEAAEGLIRALKAAEQSAAEVVLLVRGGGSYEDLMPFNDEKLALTIASLTKPVITGIGHEPDTSIADMVASLRASTPTAAAEAAAPHIQDLQRELSSLAARIETGLSRHLHLGAQSIRAFERSSVFNQKNYITSRQVLNLEQTALRLERAIPTGLTRAESVLSKTSQRLHDLLSYILRESRHVLEQKQHTLAHRGRSLTDIFGVDLTTAAARLESLSPHAVISRGYALGYDEKGNLLKTIEQVSANDQISITLSDGTIEARVINTSQRS